MKRSQENIDELRAEIAELEAKLEKAPENPPTYFVKGKSEIRAHIARKQEELDYELSLPE